MATWGLATLALLVLATTATTLYVLTFCQLPLLGVSVDLPIAWAMCAPGVTALPLLTTVPTAVPTSVPSGALADTPVPLPTDTWAPAPPPSATESLTPRPTSSLMASPTLAPSPTQSPTASPTPSPTATSSPAPSPTRTRTPTPAATLNPQGRVGLGVYQLASPYDDLAAVQQFEALLKHKMEYVLWFQAWGDSDREFSDQWIRLAANKGLVPVITWEPWKRSFENPAAFQPAYSLQSIAAGDHDEYIRTWARSARSLGIRFVIRFAHEQSTEPGTKSWYPWQGEPEAYRSAFRHIVAIFRAEGATQVQFLWSAMWLNQWANQYYPGDDVVDIVGTTAINHGTAITADWAQWRSFDDLFSGQYDAAEQWNKPIMVTELATAEQGGSKVSWLRDCFLAMKPRYPLVQGLILFEVAADREWPNINWSVASSPESLAAVRAVLTDPYFK